jgi:Zn-finger nucleic acid-binding protein
MVELDKDGITIDRCERCRGVFLDRGELEKLIAFGQGTGEPDRDRARRDDDDDDDDRRGGGGRRWWDIFD